MPIHTLLEDTEINKKGINLMTKSNRVTIRYDVQHGLNLCAGEILWSGGRSRGRPNPAYIVYMFNMTRPTGWGKNGDCPLAHHIVLMSATPLHLSLRGVTWANTWFAEYVPLVQFSFVLGSVRHFFPLPLPLGFVCFSPLMFSVWWMPVPFLSRGG